MQKLRCLIVDDEAMARKGLQKYAEQIPFLEVYDLCKNAMQVQRILLETSIDLLFLDINMPGIKGTDFLRSLRDAPHVIFTTAYSEYAIESFEFDVVDYLLKPISFERFLQAANKALRMIPTSLPSNIAEYLIIKSDGKLFRIPIADIQFLEAAQNYAYIYTFQEKHMVLSPLKQLIEQLPPQLFLQVHRSFVVAKQHIQALEGNLLLIGQHKVPISKRLRESVKQALFNDRIIGK